MGDAGDTHVSRRVVRRYPERYLRRIPPSVPATVQSNSTHRVSLRNKNTWWSMLVALGWNGASWQRSDLLKPARETVLSCFVSFDRNSV